MNYMKNSKKTLEDIQKLVNSIEVEEVGEGRFQEIVSTQKIVDTKTGKEYDGMVDVELLRLMNDVDKRNENKREQIDELKKVDALLWDIIDGFHAYLSLKNMGFFE